MDLMSPTININGTSRRGLMEQRLEAIHAIDAAIAALKYSLPHGRDYIGDETTYQKDRRIHDERIKGMLNLKATLQAEAEGFKL